MAREDTRKLILNNGAKLVHARGFVNTGIQEILDASSVPKGSFYFYFKSKEDFGQALVDHYITFISAMFNKYLKDPERTPLDRMKRYFEESCAFYTNINFSSGCPIGNLSQEMSDISEPLREKLKEAYGKMKADLKACIDEAREQGLIDPAMDTGNLATFILNGWEGALIDMKLSKSVDPLVVFKNMIFDVIIKYPQPGNNRQCGTIKKPEDSHGNLRTTEGHSRFASRDSAEDRNDHRNSQDTLHAGRGFTGRRHELQGGEHR
jgi:TetR/AcrR family transcriptional repressor of nem operon